MLSITKIANAYAMTEKLSGFLAMCNLANGDTILEAMKHLDAMESVCSEKHEQKVLRAMKQYMSTKVKDHYIDMSTIIDWDLLPKISSATLPMKEATPIPLVEKISYYGGYTGYLPESFYLQQGMTQKGISNKKYPVVGMKFCSPWTFKDFKCDEFGWMKHLPEQFKEVFEKEKCFFLPIFTMNLMRYKGKCYKVDGLRMIRLKLSKVSIPDVQYNGKYKEDSELVRV